MTVKAHGFQMQKRRFAAGTHIVRGLLRDGIGLVDIQPVGLKIPNAGAMLHRRLYPAFGRFDRDADAIVLTHKQQRQRRRLHAGPARRVDRPLRSRLVGRGISERTHGNAILGQFTMFRVVPPRRTQRIGRADRLGQMAGNGRSLRRNGQRLGPQHLVPSARGRVFAGTRKAQQHVPSNLLARHLLGPRDLKGCVAIVQKRNIRWAQRMGHGGHPLMPGRADGIEPLPRLLHRATFQIHRP